MEVERGDLRPDRRGELPHWGKQLWLWLLREGVWLYGGAWSSDLCIPHSTPISSEHEATYSVRLTYSAHSVHPTTQLEAIYRACPLGAIPAYIPNGVVCIP